MTNMHVIRYERERAKFAADNELKLAAGEKLFDVILEGDGMWHAHRACCADVARTIVKRNVNGVTPYIAKDVDDLLDQIIDPEMREELGYTKDDVIVHPCCHEKGGR